MIAQRRGEKPPKDAASALAGLVKRKKTSLSGLGRRKQNPIPRRTVFADELTTNPKPHRPDAIVVLIS
jgi:hypothetical protein